MTLGVLVMAYGTPAGPGDIERYYTDIRRGRPPSPEQLAELTARYAAIGNTFPLAEMTRRQVAGLEAALREHGDARCFFGAKHAPPFVADAVAEMAAAGIERGVGIVLAPHYSAMSIGSYIERAEAARPPGLRMTYVESWWSNTQFLDLTAERVAAALDRLPAGDRDGALVIFSAHSLPERILASGDPYPEELARTADAVAGRLGLERYTTAWQSAGRTGERWLGPTVEEVMAKAAADGVRAVVVAPCGFVSDHLEVLYDVDIDFRRVAAGLGIALERTESMNDDPRFCAALGAVVRDHLAEMG